jgi:toxin YoeB
MQRNYTFQQAAFDDFFDWSLIDKAIFKKIYELLKEISRNSFEGKGKPEPLKHHLK